MLGSKIHMIAFSKDMLGFAKEVARFKSYMLTLTMKWSFPWQYAQVKEKVICQLTGSPLEKWLN
jgi:hypothetical protein